MTMQWTHDDCGIRIMQSVRLRGEVRLAVVSPSSSVKQQAQELAFGKDC